MERRIPKHPSEPAQQHAMPVYQQTDQLKIEMNIGPSNLASSSWVARRMNQDATMKRRFITCE